ncbi:MAG: DUF6364 family protein [Chitinophagaceae bacterium]
MDAKLTLSLNKDIIAEAKEFAEANGLSLSRLVEYLLRKTTSKSYKSIEEYPVSDWVNVLMEGPVTYSREPLSNKDLRAEVEEYKASKKKNKATS